MKKIAPFVILFAGIVALSMFVTNSAQVNTLTGTEGLARNAGVQQKQVSKVADSESCTKSGESCAAAGGACCKNDAAASTGCCCKKKDASAAAAGATTAKSCCCKDKCKGKGKCCDACSKGGDCKCPTCECCCCCKKKQ